MSPWQGLGQKLVLCQQQRQNQPPCSVVQSQHRTPVHSRRERRLGRVHLYHYGRISSRQILDSVSFRVTRHRASPLPLAMGQSSTPSFPVGPRLKMCDGAGNYSSADHSIPANHPMPTKIAQAWLRWATQAGLDNQIMAHVARAAPEPPLSPREVQKAIEILDERQSVIHHHLLLSPRPNSRIDQILANLGGLTGDPDLAFLRHGARSAHGHLRPDPQQPPVASRIRS